MFAIFNLQIEPFKETKLGILVKIVHFGQKWGELSIFGASYRFLGRVINFWGELSIFGASC